jgi:hypothetical protein
MIIVGTWKERKGKGSYCSCFLQEVWSFLSVCVCVCVCVHAYLYPQTWRLTDCFMWYTWMLEEMCCGEQSIFDFWPISRPLVH